MANKRKIESPEMLEKHVKDFIAMCEESNIEPTDYALANFLSVSAATLERYEGGKGTYQGYDAALKNLVLYREHYYLGRIQTDKNPTAAIFALKQRKNGGYSDSPAITDQGVAITLKIDGVGGEAAFK